MSARLESNQAPVWLCHGAWACLDNIWSAADSGLHHRTSVPARVVAVCEPPSSQPRSRAACRSPRGQPRLRRDAEQATARSSASLRTV